MGADGIAQRLPNPAVIDLSIGQAQGTLLPVDELALAASAAWPRAGALALGYGNNAGPRPLREWLAARFNAEGARRITADDVIVTPGASYALNLICGRLLSPGEVILVETPTYDLALAIFRERGLVPVGVPTDGGGLRIDGLRAAVAHLRAGGSEVRWLYCQPTFQNPAGHSLNGDRRRQLLDALAELGLFAIEDEAYRELGITQTLNSLWAQQAPEEHLVVRVGTFSKTLGPGVRVGWLLPQDQYRDPLVNCALHRSGGSLAHLTGLAVARYCAEGMYEVWLERLKAEYQLRAEALSDALTAHLPEWRWKEPRGGFFVWAEGDRAPVTEQEFRRVCVSRGVDVRTGEAFYASPDPTRRATLRLSWSSEPPHRLGEAVRRLAGVLNDLVEQPHRDSPAPTDQACDEPVRPDRSASETGEVVDSQTAD